MKFIGQLVLVFFCLILHADDSQIYIDVGRAQVKKSLLALTPFIDIGTQTGNSAHIQAGQNLYRVVYNDLIVSNYFSFIKPEAYLEDPNKVGLRPAPGTPNGFNYKNWATIGTEFLVRGAYQITGNVMSFEVYVYHVPSTKLVLGKQYQGPTNSLRVMAHTFSNDLVQILTGKRGMFLTKIVASRQTDIKAPKEIFVMDWDGANARAITSHNSIAVSPTWSNKGDKVAYTAFAYHVTNKVRNSDLFLYNLTANKRFLVSYRKGLNSGAAFLPGDQALLLTTSQGDGADICKISADGTGLERITRGPTRSMNVEAAVSPDGKTIAFSSDRLGRPMIFTMNLDGSDVKRLTFAGKYNASPAWSPDGKTIAFAGFDTDHFDIFTMSASGGNLTRITDAKKGDGRPANNESPSWSPDGRQILFSSDRSGKYQLYLVSPDGSNERRITEDQYSWEKPKWSPFLD